MDTTLVKTFENANLGKVRVITKDGEPWFVAADICKALDIGTTAKALERIDDDERGMSSIHTPSGTQQMSVVNEFGLYSLILGSRKKEAKQFKRWITHEVLPSIRKTGKYENLKAIQATQTDERDFFVCGIHGYFGKDGGAFFKLEDTARALKITASFENKKNNPYVRWYRVRGFLVRFGYIQPNQVFDKNIFVPEDIFYRLVSHIRTDYAKKFRAIVDSELLPYIWQNPLYGGRKYKKPELDIGKSINDISKAIKDLSKLLKVLVAR